MQQSYRSEFERLLENPNEKSVHQKFIEFLLIEVHKYLIGLSPDIINVIFKLRENTSHLNLKILEHNTRYTIQYKNTIHTRIQYNALANFVKNATGGVFEKVVNKNPALKFELYNL